jgi:hypothetical protein
MKTRDERIDRMLGYVGLFIIGALGWTSDRLAELGAARLGVVPRLKNSHTAKA